MKFRLLKTLFIVFCIGILPVKASGIKVDTFSMPIKTANGIFQPLNISVSSEGAWKLFIESLSNQIHNQDNLSYYIPLTRLKLTEAGGGLLPNLAQAKLLK